MRALRESAPASAGTRLYEVIRARPGYEVAVEAALGPAAWNTDDSFFAFTRVRQYRDLMVAQGQGEKKIWFTEYGYCSNQTPPPGYEYCASIDATTQATFLVQAFQMARDLDARL